MTFDQAQRMFRFHKTYETACTYLVVASQRKASGATNPDTLFNAVGEVASWLSAPDEHLLAFEAARPQTARIRECGRGQDSARAKRPELASRR